MKERIAIAKVKYGSVQRVIILCEEELVMRGDAEVDGQAQPTGWSEDDLWRRPYGYVLQTTRALPLKRSPNITLEISPVRVLTAVE
ncbi:hypothetical protein NL676_022986 [Syzygium grande]|nr:hypothetical protein NL676_022986 [Syzygium grande]